MQANNTNYTPSLLRRLRSLFGWNNHTNNQSNGPLAESLLEQQRELQKLLEEIRAHSWQIRATIESIQITNSFGGHARYNNPLSLARYNRRMYSQQGEDGVIAEIFRRVGTQDCYFVEIGIGDGSENTTRFLLESGWRGLWIEGDPELSRKAEALMRDYIRSGRLKVVNSFVTVDNVNDLLDTHDVSQAFDYLSVDIDYNTSHVWRAINRRSRVACIEYNCTMPANLPMEVPYDADAAWDGTAWYGASLKTFEEIGRHKGLALVGCDLVGVNAYFVNHPEAEGKFVAPFTSETHFEPPRFYPFGAQHRAPIEPRVWQAHWPQA